MSLLNSEVVIPAQGAVVDYRATVLSILDVHIAQAQDNVSLSKSAACEMELRDTEDEDETDIGCSGVMAQLEGLYLLLDARQKRLAELQMCRLWLQQAT